MIDYPYIKINHEQLLKLILEQNKADPERLNLLRAVIQELLPDHKIKAIKVTRILTGWSLLAAKLYVDSLNAKEDSPYAT